MLEDSIRRWNPWWAEKDAIKALTGVNRDILEEILRTINLQHIKDILGVRRAGKTTIMYQLISTLLNNGISPKDVVFLNFDDSEINESSFEDILKAIDKINPDKKYLFIDEVHQKAGWERWVRTLYDAKILSQIFVSGSSAALLSQDIGRVLNWGRSSII